MPIIIPRTESMAAPEISQQDRNKLWEQIVRNYAEKHPELFFDAAGREDKEAS